MRIIGTVGTIGAGKTLVARYISSKYNYKIVSMRDIVADITKAAGLEPNRENLQKIGTTYRKKYGPEFFAKKVVEKILNSGWQRVIISEIRTPADAYVPKQKFGKNMIILFIDAAKDIRFRRLLHRSRLGDPKSVQEFEAQELAEWKLFDFKRTLSYVDYKIENNGTKAEFFSKIDALLLKTGFI
jgi:dephospho-CoA kinase